jgi:hypothetical protein
MSARNSRASKAARRAERARRDAAHRAGTVSVFWPDISAVAGLGPALLGEWLLSPDAGKVVVHEDEVTREELARRLAGCEFASRVTASTRVVVLDDPDALMRWSETAPAGTEGTAP